jgi:membrane fusion protein (multidrug efflux system)
MFGKFLKIFFLAAAIAAAGLLWQRGGALKGFFFGGGAPSEVQGKGAMGPMPVDAVEVEARDLVVTVDAVGTLAANESADIRAEIAGVVKAVNFSEGQPVKKGESLVNIDDSLIRTELMKAEATYNVRKETFARSDKLKTSGYVSKQDWEQSNASLQEARADIDSARIRLEKAKVPAPFDGVAGLRSFSAGDYVQVGQVLTTLDAADPVKISFSVPEKNAGDVQVGQKISFSVDAWSKKSFAGEVYAISPRVDQSTRNIDIKATAPNPDGALRTGMFARVNIVSSVRAAALIVPEQAVIPKGDDSFVFVVRDGKAILQKVSVGLRQTGIVEITSGLAAGEQVVAAGIMKLQDGMPVSTGAPAP